MFGKKMKQSDFSQFFLYNNFYQLRNKFVFKLDLKVDISFLSQNPSTAQTVIVFLLPT